MQCLLHPLPIAMPNAPLYFRSFNGHINFNHMNITPHDGNYFLSLLELVFWVSPQPHTLFPENAPSPPQSGLPYLMLLSWPQLVGWAVDTLPKPDQSHSSSNSSWANQHLCLWCLKVGLWDDTQVISGAGAESLDAVPGLGWPFPLLCLKMQSQSSERKGWGRHATRRDKKPRPPEIQWSRYHKPLSHRLPVLCKLKAKHLVSLAARAGHVIPFWPMALGRASLLE